MYSTVIEQNGKLVYALLVPGSEVYLILSRDVTEGVEHVCNRCKVREGMCSLARPKRRQIKLCHICLDKETGVF